MSIPEAIGGYFELELPPGNPFYPDLLALNSGRNAFEYVLLARQYTKVFVPYFTCDVMLEPLTRHDIPFGFYAVDENLEIPELPKLGVSEALLYTNYFGLKSAYAETLSRKVKNLILDNAQAFFNRPLPGVDTLYSPRKFFGLPDGGYLSTDAVLNAELEQDQSADRCRHLLMRLDAGAEAGYADFKRNDEALIDQPLRKMSRLTRSLLAGIDYGRALAKRNENFLFLHKRLKEKNPVNWIDPGTLHGPMVYPFYCSDDRLRKKLIENKIFVATYWPNVFTWAPADSPEYRFARNLIHLPVDQRYSPADLERITDLILPFDDLSA